MCKDNGMFNEFYKCFKGNHILLFILSLLCLIINLFLINIFLIFSFERNEDKSSSIIKRLILDRKRIFNYIKIYLVIVGTIGYEYDIRGFLSISFLVSSFFNAFFCYKENFYKGNSIVQDIIRFYIFAVHFIGNFFIFIYYVLRKKNIKGVIYMFFLFSLILIGIILMSRKDFYFLQYKNIFNLEEIEIYNQISIILRAIKEKKKSRKQFLNLISYFSFELEKNIEDNINFLEKNEVKSQYTLYLYIENIYKKKNRIIQ